MRTNLSCRLKLRLYCDSVKELLKSACLSATHAVVFQHGNVYSVCRNVARYSSALAKRVFK